MQSFHQTLPQRFSTAKGLGFHTTSFIHTHTTHVQVVNEEAVTAIGAIEIPKTGVKILDHLFLATYIDLPEVGKRHATPAQLV